jgi:uncharacterized membrane protein (UPF0127 family)
MKLIRVKIGKRTFRIKDCKGVASVWGLMFDEMKNHDGALIYANSVWMPFVKKKLNLIFLDKDMRVIGQTVASPISIDFKSWMIYKNPKAKYCLELKDTRIKIQKGVGLKFIRMADL